MLVGGLSLQWGNDRGSELALYRGAVRRRATRAPRVGGISRAPERRAGLVGEHRAHAVGGILEAIRSAGSGRVLAYLLTMSAFVNIAAPYFTPYMFGPLATLVRAVHDADRHALVARIAILPYFAALAERRGTRVLLGWGAFGIVPLPVLWLVSDHFAYLVALQALSGTAWAALEFATMLSFFEGIADRDRARVLSAFNLANASAVAIGALSAARSSRRWTARTRRTRCCSRSRWRVGSPRSGGSATKWRAPV